MQRISTSPSSPMKTQTSTITTTNLSQKVINSLNAQQSHHLHNHYHYSLQQQQSSLNQHQQQPQLQHQRNNHLNSVPSTATLKDYAHIRNRNPVVGAMHKKNAINNNNYPYRTNAGIWRELKQHTTNMPKQKKQKKKSFCLFFFSSPKFELSLSSCNCFSIVSFTE